MLMGQVQEEVANASSRIAPSWKEGGLWLDGHVVTIGFVSRRWRPEG